MTHRGGVLPSQWIRRALTDGTMTASRPVEPTQIQPNSIDLRIGRAGTRVQCSFLPGREGVEGRLRRFGIYPVDAGPDGVVLERNAVYLFPLMEGLKLPPGLRARANPKSSTGRLDIFCRLVTEYGTSFDDIPDGFAGQLFLEVVPRSFPIRVREGDSLAQLRFVVGDPTLDDDETRALMAREPIIVVPDTLSRGHAALRIEDGVFMSVNLSAEGTVGYRAKRNTGAIDLRGKHRISHFWERIYHRPSEPLLLEPDEFYILRSNELVRLPPDVCAEMVPFDAGAGEVRTHYAGFFDSGFGYAGADDNAAAAAAVVLEVRGRDVPFHVDEGNHLFRVVLLRNQEAPDDLYGRGLRSHYQGQRLRLSKQFLPDDAEADSQLPLRFP
ncbi:MAG: Deoxycytidine deaminase [Myxococcaceae bacterium]|nr:Deoxycytidine deaminase [Myxococcaceae bacterium]